jgi:hypothetical protein
MPQTKTKTLKQWQCVDLEKDVIKILKELKQEWQLRSYSQVIKRLYADFKTWN